MSGNKHNNKLKIQNLKLKAESGQVLLIVVMLLATALTVALAVSFKSTTETQVTKLEEDSQRALAAAEAGIEAALKQTNTLVPIGANLSGDLSAFSGQAICRETSDKTYFISPLLTNNEQYTFYLADKNFSSYWSGNLNIYFKSETGSSPAVELTFISSTNALTRYLLEPGSVVEDAGNNATLTTNINPPQPLDVGNPTTFAKRTSSAFAISNMKLLIVRALGGETKIGFSGGSTMLFSQGKTCDSNAQVTGSGVTKKVELLQTYPQIASEFFITSL